MKTNRDLLVVSLVMIICLLCTASAAFGAGGSLSSYWGENTSIRGDNWEGEIVLVGLVEDPSRAFLHPKSNDFTNSIDLPSPFPYDPIVSGIFIARLENKKLGAISCSGQAYAYDYDENDLIDSTGPKYFNFHAIGDRLRTDQYLLMADALRNFLDIEVKKALVYEKGYPEGIQVILGEVLQETDNAAQLGLGADGTVFGDFSSPLFITLKVTVVVP